ncbi:FGGY-family carbohydrate kinase [Segetibacter aerophilus]|uniref:Carbohydrate kinase n=1 Tax=Segetibacter aerophilus TaxID=670293 RepID=A0A512BH38_9BACT|nr:FGGY-family carbohydrate kinase [Segetibacter aerophilus]GEO11185.1 carbohydrate kinase [Segetibacter aerophilus]
MTAPFFLGVDIGTQGARVVLIDSKGNQIGSEEEDFALSDESREEQSPAEWWQALLRSLKRLVDKARLVVDVDYIKAIAVTSTSGTVIPIAVNNEPLHNAIMYSDKRSAEEGKLCREAALRHNNTGYTGFNSSSGLSKIVWYLRHFPTQVEKIRRWVHASDFITGKLSGNWGVTDYTNALKSGYDLINLCWPEYLSTELQIKKEWLPNVVASGTAVGTLNKDVALEIGLKNTIQIVAGMTDGCASQIASGAVNLGDWNTTIGTTLVVKGVTKNAITDPEETLYNHLHPEGFWMPGGASNIGADWITRDFKEDLDLLNEQAQLLIPTGKIAYPLRQAGERFPFVAPHARGFQEKGLTREEAFAANMEGVAYVERYAYQMIEKLSGEKVKVIYTAGGASNSSVWLKIRSNVLNLPIYKMKYVTGAFGAAILAASKTHFSNIIEATQALTQIEKEVMPEKILVEKYQTIYYSFLQALKEKGYIKNEVNA